MDIIALLVTSVRHQSVLILTRNTCCPFVQHILMLCPGPVNQTGVAIKRDTKQKL
jgi:hypothetical protein